MQLEYKVKDGQNIYDVASLVYGSPSYAIKLAQDNYVAISQDLTGITLTYDSTIKDTTAFSIRTRPEKETTGYITATDGQSIYDIVLMTSGSLESVFQFIQDNNIVSIGSGVQAGQEYIYTISKGALIDYFTKNRTIINTNVIGTDGEGIDFMGIEFDFIIR